MLKTLPFFLRLLPGATLLFVLVFLSVANAQAQFIHFENNVKAFGFDPRFVAPNELFPDKALPVFRRAPIGAYVSVGTERGFMGAANSPNVTHLVLVDYNPSAVMFNRINIILLKMAKNREDYLRLRFGGSRFTYSKFKLMRELFKKIRVKWVEHAEDPLFGFPGSKLDAIEEAYEELFPGRDYQSFMEEARKAGLSQEELDLLVLTNEKNYDGKGKTNLQVWDEFVNIGLRFRKFNRKQLPGLGKFSKVNYLFNDTAFDKISQMAKEDKIVAGHVDLANPEDVEPLVRQLREQKIPLSVLDISNAWWWRHMGSKGTVNALNSFDEIATEKSLLLITQRNNALLWPLQLPLDRFYAAIVYKAFTFKLLRKFPTFLDFSRYLWPQNALPVFYTSIDSWDAHLGALCARLLELKKRLQ